MPAKKRTATPVTGDVATAAIAERYADEHAPFIAKELGRLEKRTVSRREARAYAKLFLGKEWVSGFVLPKYGIPMMEDALGTILVIHDIGPKHLDGWTPKTPQSVHAAVDALGCLRAGNEFRCGVLVEKIQAMMQWHAASTHRENLAKLNGGRTDTHSEENIRKALAMREAHVPGDGKVADCEAAILKATGIPPRTLREYRKQIVGKS